jgi:hypothetical protein
MEMTRVYQAWTHLASVRRRGQTHGIDRVISSRRANSLAIPCPACPELGFNVDKHVVENASEDEM